MVFNEKELTPKYVADLWMNGHYFHNDDGKYAALESMLGYELAFVKAYFIEFVIQATYVITYVGRWSSTRQRRISYGSGCASQYEHGT